MFETGASQMRRSSLSHDNMFYAGSGHPAFYKIVKLNRMPFVNRGCRGTEISFGRHGDGHSLASGLSESLIKGRFLAEHGGPHRVFG